MALFPISRRVLPLKCQKHAESLFCLFIAPKFVKEWGYKLDVRKKYFLCTRAVTKTKYKGIFLLHWPSRPGDFPLSFTSLAVMFCCITDQNSSIYRSTLLGIISVPLVYYHAGSEIWIKNDWHINNNRTT